MEINYKEWHSVVGQIENFEEGRGYWINRNNGEIVLTDSKSAGYIEHKKKLVAEKVEGKKRAVVRKDNAARVRVEKQIRKEQREVAKVDRDKRKANSAGNRQMLVSLRQQETTARKARNYELAMDLAKKIDELKANM